MRDNPVQFAVVREDAELELEVLARHPARRALLVASGGCTALTLARRRPDLRLTLLDPNPAQLELVERKAAALTERDPARRKARFNVEDDDPDGLSECGNFESLFRGLRGLLHDLVLPRSEWRAQFERPSPARLEAAFAGPWWPAAFDVFFAEPLLVTMFGPDAVQHAERGSYPAYFRRLFERGLRAPGARDNRFLHHVLLGHYLDRPAALPIFLREAGPTPRFELFQGRIPELPTLGDHDFVGLSNILDWMEPAAVESLVELLCAELPSGATVLWRQLNNDRDLEALFRDRFAFDAEAGARLHAADRSLFYSSVHVGTKT